MINIDIRKLLQCKFENICWDLKRNFGQKISKLALLLLKGEIPCPKPTKKEWRRKKLKPVLKPSTQWHRDTPKTQKMWRTVDVHLRALRFFPSPQPSFTIRPVCTILTPKAHTLAAPQTLSLRTIVTTSVFSIFKGLGTRGSGSNFGLTVVRCVSSVSPAPTLEWNEPVSCSEVGNGDSGSVEEDSKSSIPVRAYFFSTRFASICLFFYNFLRISLNYECWVFYRFIYLAIWKCIVRVW